MGLGASRLRGLLVEIPGRVSHIPIRDIDCEMEAEGFIGLNDMTYEELSEVV